MKKVPFRKKILILVALCLGIILTMFGGIKLVIYILLLVTGVLVGWNAFRIKRIVDDYRLSLKVNTVLYSSKRTEEMTKELETLRSELRSANDRISLMKGMKHVDNLDSNSAPGMG